ncbi:MAG: hypothetical protein KAI95_20930 [Bacteroidales bacterium]|nr:hypothetical protein [Bacteroidales bacterium]
MNKKIIRVFTIATLLLGIHAVFLLLLTGTSAGALRRLKENDGEEMAMQKDEMVFTIAQYVGLICGIIGLVWTVFALVMSQRLPVSYYHMLATSIMIMIPYGLVVTIPVMLALYLVIHNDTLFARGDYFWFPFLIFISLTLFSVLTLIHYHET